MPDVKRSHRYDGRRRREKAEQGRLAVLESARRLLLERGYAATSLPLVAADAGVSAHTVYKAFRNKPTLLKAVFDYAIAGDDEPVPILQRERAARLRAEPDPREKLRIYTDGLIGTLTRGAALHLLARAAADSDPEVASIWAQTQTERLTGMTHLADHLAEGGHLALNVSAADARDILWAYTSPELYQLLVLQRGWSPERYRDWTREMLIAALLQG
jgi:AcrR family transcriptional regulator